MNAQRFELVRQEVGGEDREEILENLEKAIKEEQSAGRKRKLIMMKDIILWTTEVRRRDTEESLPSISRILEMMEASTRLRKDASTQTEDQLQPDKTL